jgi:SAM-dependent methyltransferase
VVALTVPDLVQRASVRRVARLLLPTVLLLGSCAAARPPQPELDQLTAALVLRPGMRVADVGAGKGEWSEALATSVGESGHVFSTEVSEDHVEEIRGRIDDAGLANVTVVLGDQLETGLPDGCCDAILLRLVYHHFTDPEPMRDELRRALRPGGRLAIVEIQPQTRWGELEGVPDRGGHGISPDDLVQEMQSDGWVVVERHDDWGDEDDHYCVVFR